ncbi:MAG: hypothetical protein UD936_05495 [Acutalibacteraceae bacterium]|nr:hypothetical protein [Acutalibacteraceae bacterium]
MNLFGPKLFGNNIDTSCEYCNNSQKINGIILCKANKEIVNGNCSKFKYNPLMRVPKTAPRFPQYDPKDFEL